MAFRKTVYCCLVTLCELLYSLPVSARIPTGAFKGVTQYFQQGKEVYSPTLGVTAVESGLIYNLRFYGNFTAAYQEDKNVNRTRTRSYINDTSKDPVWNVLHILFPSPAGNLAVETQSPHNLGKHITSPRTVALLLNYAHQLRTKGKYISLPSNIPTPPAYPPSAKDKKLKPMIFPTTLAIFMDVFKEYMHKGFWQPTDIQLSLITQYDQTLSPQSSGSSQYKSPPTQKPSRIYLTPDQIEIYIQNEQSKQKSPQVAKKTVVEPDPLAIHTQVFFNSLTITPDTHQSNLKKVVKDLLALIRAAIHHEEKLGYPSYTTEQIILAFFCEKFNTQQDIWALIQDLAALDVNQTMIQGADQLNPKAENLLVVQDLPFIAQTPNPTIDDIYLLANADLFKRLTPYKPGTSPIGNGNTWAFRRQSPEEKTQTFPECIELIMRHIFNFMLYNSHARQFDLTALRKHLTQSQDSNALLYFKNLEEFYAHQPPGLANSGDIVIRSLWNRVVGDLNGLDQGQPLTIFYRSGNPPYYDMNPGFINLIHGLAKLLGISLTPLDPQASDLKAKKGWVEASFKTIFAALNPHHSYEFNTEKLKVGKGRHNQVEILGDLIITVKNSFSITIQMTQNHGQVSNFKSFEDQNTNNYSQDALKLQPVLHPGTTERSLLLLLPTDPAIQQEPLYTLYPLILEGNDSRLSALEQLTLLAPQASTEVHKNLLIHLLDNLSWDDPETVEKVTPLVLKLAPLFPEIINDNIKRLKITDQLNEQDLLNLRFFLNLEELDVSGTQKFQQLPLSGLTRLKVLDISGSAIEALPGLNECTALENLNASATQQLKQLQLMGLTQLKILNISKSGIGSLLGLEECTTLEILNAFTTKKLTQLSLTRLTQLKELHISDSAIETLSGLNECIALETLNAPLTKNLTQLSLKGLTQLKILNVSKSEIESLPGLEECTALESLNAAFTQKIPQLSLRGLTQLKLLTISFSAIESLPGLEECTALEILNAFSTHKLTQLSLTGLTQLKELHIFKSMIEALPGLEGCTVLEILDAASTKRLIQLSLAGLTQLKTLDISGSAIETLLNLNECTVLEILDVSFTQKLTQLQLTGLTQLKELNISDSAITELPGLSQRGPLPKIIQ